MNFNNEIIQSMCLIVIVLILGICLGFIIRDFLYRRERLQNVQLISDLQKRLSDYSEFDTSDMIRKFILQIVTDVAIMEFHEFKDSHNLKKVSSANVRDLVAKVATDARGMIDTQKMKKYDNVLGKDFCDKYIIYSASTLVKNILEKEVVIITEEEG